MLPWDVAREELTHPPPVFIRRRKQKMLSETILLAQNYGAVYGLVSLGLVLGVLAVSIPRIRKKVPLEDD